jgi:hypothetical protein
MACSGCAKRREQFGLRSVSQPTTGGDYRLDVNGHTVGTYPTALDAAAAATGQPGAVIVYTG